MKVTVCVVCAAIIEELKFIEYTKIIKESPYSLYVTVCIRTLENRITRIQCKYTNAYPEAWY